MLRLKLAQPVAPGPEYQPQPHVAALYDELYAVYRALYPALRGEFGRLAAVPDVTLGDS